jgi:hypothetical protein
MAVFYLDAADCPSLLLQPEGRNNDHAAKRSETTSTQPSFKTYFCPCGDPRQHHHRVQAATLPKLDVRVHAIANHEAAAQIQVSHAPQHLQHFGAGFAHNHVRFTGRKTKCRQNPSQGSGCRGGTGRTDLLQTPRRATQYRSLAASCPQQVTFDPYFIEAQTSIAEGVHKANP